MATMTERETIKTLTTHYIDGAFVESHGREVMDIIKPTNGQVIARVTLADEEDARRAIDAARRAFASFGKTTKDERSRYLRQLQKVVSAHIDDLTAVMIEEYGGVAVCPAYCRVGCQCLCSGREGTSRAAVEGKLGQDDSHDGASRRRRSDYSLERECVVHLPQTCIGHSGWLYGRHETERNEFAANPHNG
jgi:Aldehyde dehydrogenase family